MNSSILRNTLEAAIKLHAAGRIEEAEPLYRQVLVASPGQPDALHLLGVIAYQRGKPDEALPLIEQAIRSLPKEASYRNNLGLVLGALGRQQEALAAFLSAVELQPDYADAYSNMGCTLRALNQTVEAQSCLCRALELDPNQVQAHSNLGGLLADLGKKEEALGHFQAILSLVPGHPEAMSNRGFTLSELGRHEEAEATLRATVAQHPKFAWGWNNLGVVLMRRKKMEEAAECFQHALEADANHPIAAQNLASVRLYLEADNAARRSILDYAPNGEKALRGLPALRQQTETFTYVVEVAEACNLRCPSCPQGNLRDVKRPGGLIGVDTFHRILEKIRQESPVERPALWLFNWGEPFLHPELPELVRMVKSKGMYCMLSTNLNIDRNLEEVLMSRPDEIKISLSGLSQPVYGATHTRGAAERVRNNLRRLREIEDRVRSGARIWVGFHLYRHNLVEYREMGDFVRSLGFGFTTQIATLQPLEKMIEYMDGKLPARDKEFVAQYPIFDPVERVHLKQAYLVDGADCEARYNMMSIGHDGMVDLCCNSFRPENRLGLNFLDTPHAELQAAKYRHPFCGECYKHGLQMQVLPDEAVQAIFLAEDVAIQRVAAAQNMKWK